MDHHSRRAPAPGALFRVRGTLCASVARPESDRVAQAVATTQESWRLSSGKEIDRSLVVINDLGGGSRYEVFRAWDRQLFCQVAVKVMRPNRVHEDRVMDGFEREIGIASRLQHPNLVRLLRWNAAPPRPYMVLEYVSAQTVAAHLENIGEVSIPEVCLLGIRMLSALQYMHSNHVLHLDVKPDNVTMGDPPRLLDFSLAQAFSGPVRLRHTMGTAAYMPPEQFMHGVVGPESDLFGLTRRSSTRSSWKTPNRFTTRWICHRCSRGS
ncbi:MAG: serine/threonine protein kinase [Chloroflexi bacterium]|nr:MAG: serine/threonine protein kinase [Chloroflexota bacterium]